MKCLNCKKNIKKDAKFCPYCGAKVEKLRKLSRKKNKKGAVDIKITKEETIKPKTKLSKTVPKVDLASGIERRKRLIKIVMVCLVVFIIAAAGFLYLKIGKIKLISVSPQTIMPGDIGTYFELSLVSSKEQAADLDTILKKFEEDKTKEVWQNVLQKQFFGLNFYEDVKPWLGNTIAFGGNLEYENIVSQNNISKSGLIILVEYKKKSLCKKRLGKLEQSARDQGGSVEKMEYKKFSVTQIIDKDNNKMIYTFVDSFLVLANNEEGLKLVIDTEEGAVSSLAKNENFIQAKTRLVKSPIALFYTKLGKGSQAESIENLCLGVSVDQQGFKISGYISGSSEKFSNIPSFSPELVNVMPNNVVVFGEGFNLTNLINGVWKARSGEEKMGESKKSVNQFLGMDLDIDILSWMDQEYGITLAQKDSSPLISLVLKIKDKNKVSQIVEKLESSLVKYVIGQIIPQESISQIGPDIFSSFLKFKEENKIRYLEMGPISVAYKVTDNEFIISSSKKTIQDISNLMADKGTPLSENELYKEVFDKIETQDVCGLVYLSMNDLVSLLSGFLGKNIQNFDVIQEYLSPLKAAGFVGKPQVDGVKIEGYLLVK